MLIRFYTYSIQLILVVALMLTSILSRGQRPNIIYILADDLGYGDVRAYNPNSKIPTPSIDALANAGMRFTDAHTNSSVCSPTRYGILTGRYAWRSRLKKGVLWSYDKPLITTDRMTVAQLLKNQGYQTACIGKWHLGLDWTYGEEGEVDLHQPIQNGPTRLGFDYFFGISASLDIPPYVYIEGEKTTALSIDSIAEKTGKEFWRAGPIGDDFQHREVLDTFFSKSIQFIKQASVHDKPFFLYLPLSSPHTPILPSNSFTGRTETNAYGDFVQMTDHKIGELLQVLKELGLDNNTMIIFTSDNGCSPTANFKELKSVGHDPSAGYRGHKADIYEGGHRVPFVVKWPGVVRPGSTNDQTICLTDFIATCSDLLNVPLNDSTAEDSHSLLPILVPKSNTVYQRTSTIHHSIDGFFAIRKGDWKLALCSGSGGWSSPTEGQAKKDTLPTVQLFNLKEDPGEQHNVSEKFPALVRELKNNLEQIIARGRSK